MRWLDPGKNPKKKLEVQNPNAPHGCAETHQLPPQVEGCGCCIGRLAIAYHEVRREGGGGGGAQEGMHELRGSREQGGVQGNTWTRNHSSLVITHHHSS